MKNNLISSMFIVAFLFSLIETSCKKKDDCDASKPGNLTVKVYLENNSKNIPNQTGHPDTVFIKYNVLYKPLSAYDKKFIGVEGEDHVDVTGLNCGDYYFFASGLDTLNDTLVTGGYSFSTDNNSGDVTLKLAVSEKN